jgi:hypothetical protein
MPQFATQCVCVLLAILTDTQFVPVQNSTIRLTGTQFGIVRPADTTSPYLNGARTRTEQ